MRRQARISGGGALVVRSASALQVWLWLLIFIFQNEFRISRSIQPGYLDFDNLPETNFTCAGKVIGGYYADLETSCQMFHVCTVGQQDEPMDIKFLCLNGTVFDQETRVCERVDEVDCTKSEKFYSLNLELYGSTAPPIIQPEQNKSETTNNKRENENDPSIDEIYTTAHNKSPQQTHDIPDSTEDPVQDITKDDHRYTQSISSTYSALPPSGNDELTEEYQDEDNTDGGEYEDYSHAHSTTTETPTTTTSKKPTTSKRTTTTTTTNRPSTSSPTTSSIPYLNSSPTPILSSISPPFSSSLQPSAPSAPSAISLPNLDPTILSPQEFIYRHQQGTEAVSYQSFRPADGVYITHAPPQQFDHFQYESSRTAPRPTAPRPTPFAQRPQPAPFRATTLDPRDQLLRPGPSSQPSERHETTVKNRQPQQQPQKTYPSSLPAQRPLPFNPYFYDRKRSDDSASENQSSLSARSVAPPAVTERPPVRLKSPPRVIVTASASVSDSNGKRLNYTVGNVVSAVKPIVPINYDDYKESDLIFDPFFLDVPKLQKRRKTRSNHNRSIFTASATATIPSQLSHDKVTVATITATSKTTTTKRLITSPIIATTTVGWDPNDYVDDNYEPHAYIPPIPPLAILVSQDIEKHKIQNSQLNNKIHGNNNLRRDKTKAGRSLSFKVTTEPSELITSSQIKKAETVAPVASPPFSPPLEASLRAL